MKNFFCSFLIFLVIMNSSCKRSYNEHIKGGAITLLFISVATRELSNAANIFFSNNMNNVDNREESISLHNESLSGKLRQNYFEIRFKNYNIGNNTVFNGLVIVHREKPNETIYNGSINVEGLSNFSNINFIECILPTQSIINILFRLKGHVIIDDNKYSFRQIFSALEYFSRSIKEK